MDKTEMLETGKRCPFCNVIIEIKMVDGVSKLVDNGTKTPHSC